MQTLARLLALPFLALLLSLTLSASPAHAEARVFDLTTPNPDEVVRVLQTTYGDKVRIDLIQQRLVVVGSRKQLDEVAELLAKLDRPLSPLRLTLRESPPPVVEREGTMVYSSGDDGRVVDTAEGALVVVDYQQVAQQPVSDGWMVAIENQPQTIDSIMLQIQLLNPRTAQVRVSFADQRNQQRRVYANTLTAEIGAWVPLLPQKASEVEGAKGYSSGPKRGEQVYLRVEKRTR